MISRSGKSAKMNGSPTGRPALAHLTKGRLTGYEGFSSGPSRGMFQRHGGWDMLPGLRVDGWAGAGMSLIRRVPGLGRRAGLDGFRCNLRCAGTMFRMRPFYSFCRFVCQGFSVAYLGTRSIGLQNVPTEGGALLVSNHQSFLDPVVVGVHIRREVQFMARDTLFGHPLFGWLIRAVNAFPVRRNTADLGAIKEAMRRLKQGHLLLMFPEGTRTPDGRVQPLLPGMFAIAKKAGVPIVPVLIDGVFKAWPRHQLLPVPGDVIVEYGRPILPAEFRNLSPEQMTEAVRDRLVAMQARRHRLQPHRRLQ